MMTYGDGGWWIVMWVSMAAFWGLLIIGVFAILNGLGGSRAKESPDETIDRRFAAGEIDQTEYRALREELHRRPGAPASQSSQPSVN